MPFVTLRQFTIELLGLKKHYLSTKDLQTEGSDAASACMATPF
jgi:hypothetical protein